jgi:hypothetical protein
MAAVGMIVILLNIIIKRGEGNEYRGRGGKKAGNQSWF